MVSYKPKRTEKLKHKVSMFTASRRRGKCLSNSYRTRKKNLNRAKRMMIQFSKRFGGFPLLD